MKQKQTAFTIENFVLWVPRSLMLVFVFLMGTFAFPGESIMLLLLNLIPSFVLLLTLLLAWKKPFWGGILFIFWGIVSIFLWSTFANFSAFMAITIPLLSGGGLFILQKHIK